MTDRFGGARHSRWAALARAPSALEDFHERYRDDPLVLDKWLTLEAMVPAPETLDRVRALLAIPPSRSPTRTASARWSAPLPAATRPNSTAPTAPATNFSPISSLDLDRRNPQTAARLLVSFRSWRALEPRRRALAEAALHRVAATEKLSPDARDIVTRTLR